MSPTSHGYWVELDSGKGLRTTVVVKPKFSGTVKDGIQAMNRGQDPGDAVHEDDKPKPSYMEQCWNLKTLQPSKTYLEPRNLLEPRSLLIPFGTFM